MSGVWAAELNKKRKLLLLALKVPRKWPFMLDISVSCIYSLLVDVTACFQVLGRAGRLATGFSDHIVLYIIYRE